MLSACGAVRSLVGQLEASFLLACKRLIDGAPAGSLRMRLISALATGPLRGMILRFYAQVGGERQHNAGSRQQAEKAIIFGSLMVRHVCCLT